MYREVVASLQLGLEIFLVKMHFHRDSVRVAGIHAIRFELSRSCREKSEKNLAVNTVTLAKTGKLLCRRELDTFWVKPVTSRFRECHLIRVSCLRHVPLSFRKLSRGDQANLKTKIPESTRPRYTPSTTFHYKFPASR